MANEGRLTERQILRRLKNLAETNQDREFLPADSWGGLASEISWLPSLERGDPGRERVNALAVKVKRLADEFAHLEKRHKAANARCTMSLAAIAIDPAYVGLDDKTIRLRLVVNSSDGEPSFALQIVKEELLRNEIIQEFKEKVIALLPENPVRIGTFSA